MADKDSTIISNIDTDPRTVLTRANYGVVRKIWESITTDTIQADADELRFFRVHSSWIYVSHRVAWADVGGATSDLEVGLYLADSGAVLDFDCFSAGLDLSSAGDTGDIVTPAGAASTTVVESMFDLGGGTAANDDQWYDVVGTINTLATDAAGLILIEMWYVDPGA